MFCASVAHGQPVLNDYPTEARADYVFACMAANGQTREVLSRCSCSIDVIASILPYDRYVEAETVLSMRQVGGEKTAIFRNAAMMREVVADLRRAQAEGEIRCF
nr:hypothetical protein [Thermohalobaculum xanthum]